MKQRIGAIFLAFAVVIAFSVAIIPNTVTASYVDDFLATVGPMCTNDMRANKILASFTMAQAIYESGWGQSTLAVEANNLFGMRAYSTWTGKVYDRNEGVLYNSWDELVSEKGSSYVSNYSLSFWRAFDSWQESVNSHSELFNTSSRYSNLRGNYDYKSCCTLVVEDGYCTDSGYAENLISLIEKYNLEQFNYDFAANGEDGSVTPEEEPDLGTNLFAGTAVNYYLKGKWAEFSGTTALPTDGAYRGDGINSWNGNSAVSGVTFDTADYNSANATANFFTFTLEEPAQIGIIAINGYRENGNRSYGTLEIYASTDAVTVDTGNYETVTDGMTKVDYSIEKKAISDAPEAMSAAQYYNLYLSFDCSDGIKSVLIKTNVYYAADAFFQFDEIAAYAPWSDALPFTFADGADTSCVAIDAESGVLTLKNGVMTAEAIMAIFSDQEMEMTDADGNSLTNERGASTGCVITTTINNVSTSLVLVVCGDINKDAVVSAADYIALCAYIKGTAELDVTSVLASDIDSSGAVSSSDYIALKQRLN